MSFREIVDRQLEVPREGEMERQAHGDHHTGKRACREGGYKHSPRKVRRRMQRSMGR